jgi:hypothetical protein
MNPYIHLKSKQKTSLKSKHQENLKNLSLNPSIPNKPKRLVVYVFLSSSLPHDSISYCALSVSAYP